MNQHVQAGEKYVREVRAGKIPVCKWVRLACQRHFEDKARSRLKDYPYKFVPETAETAAKFMECFPHVKGRWGKRRDPFRLEPWQCFMVMSIFGWVRKDTKTRRFRRAVPCAATGIAEDS